MQVSRILCSLYMKLTCDNNGLWWDKGHCCLFCFVHFFTFLRLAGRVLTKATVSVSIVRDCSIVRRSLFAARTSFSSLSPFLHTNLYVAALNLNEMRKIWIKTKQSTILAKCKRLQHNKACEEIVNSYLVSTALSDNSYFSSGSKICSGFSQDAKTKLF